MLNELERLTGSLADRYRIQRELGRGGMATVYLAEDVKHHRAVALKVLDPELAKSVGSERFLREIEISARLDHPHILPLLDSGEADGFLYYVMPYVDGESLRDRLNREKQLPVGDALQIVRDVADALGYAHDHGIVHRDIKPENILLSGKHARVADFGIAFAVAAAGGERLTETGLAIGTAAYMSPEQATGSTELDGRSDLYSLGCVAYEMFAGDPPFTGTNPQALLARKAVQTAAPLRPVRPSVSAHVEKAVLVALAPVPADRFATLTDFLFALDQTVPVMEAPAPILARLRRRVPVSVALLVLSLVLALVWHPWSRGGSPSAQNSPTRIAVFPFVVEDPQLSYLREGVMDLLSHAIDGAGEIRRVDPNALIARLPNAKPVDLETASHVAQELGAGRFLLGRVVPSGQSVQILASLYIGDDRSEPEHRFVQEGHIDSVSTVIAALARELLLHVPTGPGTWVTEPSAPITGGTVAIREYSRGEALLRRFQVDSAAKAFRKALAADSTFALGWLRLSFAADFGGGSEGEMIEAVDRAMQFPERLGPRDRMLAEAVQRQYHGDGEEAERLALALVGRYPEYAEGWYRLGMTQLWWAWRRGRSPLDAEAAFEKALAVDPEHRQVMYALSWMAALRGRRTRALSLRTRAFGRPSDRMPADSAAFPLFLEQVASLPTPRVISITNREAWLEDRLSDVSRLARLLADSTRRPDEDRMVGHILRGRIEAAAGRWRHSEAAFRDADDAGLGVGLIEAGWIAAVPLAGVSAESRRTIRSSLIRWAAPARDAMNAESRPRQQFRGHLVLEPWLRPHARHYVIGLLSAGLGDGKEAQRYAHLLLNAVEPADSIGLLYDLSLEIRALLAMQERDTAAALEILDSAGLRVASHYQVRGSPFHMRPVTRLLRAAGLASTGRHREALGWYAAIGHRLDAPEWVFLAGTSLRQGELYEHLNEPAKAVYHYRRFVARWEHADSVHQRLVTDVRQRLERLEGNSK